MTVGGPFPNHRRSGRNRRRHCRRFLLRIKAERLNSRGPEGETEVARFCGPLLFNLYGGEGDLVAPTVESC